METIEAYVIPGEVVPLRLQSLGNLVLRTRLACAALATECPIEIYVVAGEIGEGKFKSPQEFMDRIRSAVKPTDFVRQSKIAPDATWDNTEWKDVYSDYCSYTDQINSWHKQNISLKAVEEKLKTAGLPFERDFSFSYGEAYPTEGVF